MPKLVLSFLLDDSGSMQRVREATISGYNEFLISQRSVPGDVLFTLCKFSSPGKFSVDEELTPIDKVAELHPDTYFPNGGSTALYDGIDEFLDLVEKNVALVELQSASGEEIDVINVIITDGGENSSVTKKREDSFKRITALQKDKQWNFAYLGANQDAYEVGSGLGVARGSTRTYAGNAKGTVATFAAVSNSTTQYRTLRSAGGQSVSYNADLLAGAPEVITGEDDNDRC